MNRAFLIAIILLAVRAVIFQFHEPPPFEDAVQALRFTGWADLALTLGLFFFYNGRTKRKHYD